MIKLNQETIIHTLSEINNGNRFYIKRDDLLPFSFGGNKARKATLFLEDIKNKGSNVVVTYGSGSSNHCRVIANMAVSQGLKCFIVSPEEGYEVSPNSKMVELFGAQIIKTPLDRVSQTIDTLMNDLSKKYNPYFIAGGGHGNIGTKAYVEAYKEICRYENETEIYFDYVFHASGTGTTQAGLVCGQILEEDDKRKIIGISIARQSDYGKQIIVDSVNDYLDDNSAVSSRYVNFIDDYLCGGYGKFNKDIMKTIKRVLSQDGIALNTIYTGKAYFGMIDYISKNDIKDKNILFLNTGGMPLFFDTLKLMSGV